MSADFRSPEDVFAWAEGFTNFEKGRLPTDKRNYRLDRMSVLLDAFGRPDSAYKTIHVAGTKGKGSTSALIASAIEASGEKTGLYTSPHVGTPRERIMVCGGFPEPGKFVETGRALKTAVETLGNLPGGFPPTTFELYTMLAFLCFRDEGCRSAVIETGIGGRLDATNVILPEASVITPLDLEHTDILGDTIVKIAAEKAGIIKEETPAFIAAQPPEAKEVFRQAARRAHASITFFDEERERLESSVSADGTSFTIKLSGMERAEFRLSMLGAFQAENAALAYLALKKLRPDIPAGAYACGFFKAALPGRMEIVRRSPALMLDGAHTPLAVRRLLESFMDIFPGKAVLIFGSVAGKKPHEMAEILAPVFERIVISTPGSFKASDPEEVFSIFRSLNPRTLLEKDPEAALARAMDLSAGKLPILVTGSFYMVSEIRKLVMSGG
jgi:dihydrofolate synthase/folylpolyglutamate synthase